LSLLDDQKFDFSSNDGKDLVEIELLPLRLLLKQLSSCEGNLLFWYLGPLWLQENGTKSEQGNLRKQVFHLFNTTNGQFLLRNVCLTTRPMLPGHFIF